MSETVVITGANRGLGLEFARIYAARGDTVIAGCRNPSDATELATLTARVHPLDVGDEASIEAFAAAIGDETVDILLNNAGIDARNLGADESERELLIQSAEHILGQVRVNAVGPLLLSRRLRTNVARSERPRIVNMSSQLGSMEIAAHLGHDIGYAISKAALNMVTVKLASRFAADGIIAVTLHPGWVRTAMGGPGAAMEAPDAAGQIVELVDGLTLVDSGTFRRFDGSAHPW